MRNLRIAAANQGIGCVHREEVLSEQPKSMKQTKLETDKVIT
jgi:hypothetical protein